MVPGPGPRDIRPAPAETADSNNDGSANITDPIFILNYLFLGGAAPASPGPTTCGADTDALGSPGDMGCASYAKC